MEWKRKLRKLKKEKCLGSSTNQFLVGPQKKCPSVWCRNAFSHPNVCVFKVYICRSPLKRHMPLYDQTVKKWWKPSIRRNSPPACHLFSAPSLISQHTAHLLHSIHLSEHSEHSIQIQRSLDAATNKRFVSSQVKWEWFMVATTSGSQHPTRHPFGRQNAGDVRGAWIILNRCSSLPCAFKWCLWWLNYPFDLMKYEWFDSIANLLKRLKVSFLFSIEHAFYVYLFRK